MVNMVILHSKAYFIGLLGFACIFFGAESNDNELVKITKFDVPLHAKIEDDVELTCEYNVKPDRLYIVQWHHNNREIYRYTKNKDEPKMRFPGNGIEVNLDESSATSVVLMNLNLSASGTYRCLVIAEKPKFKKASKEANMTVVVIPNSKPLIEPPLGDSLRPGSMVNLNCSSSPSIPAATLEWKVNGKPVPNSYLQDYSPEKNEEGLYVSRLGLFFKVEKKHFVNSTLNLKCISNIATLYDKSDEHSHQLPHGSTHADHAEPPAQPAIGSNLMKHNDGSTNSFCKGLWIMVMLSLLNLR